MTHVKVVGELDVDVEVGASDGPAHSTEDLVEGVDRVDSRTEVTGGDQDVVDLLEELLLVLLLHIRYLTNGGLGLKHI